MLLTKIAETEEIPQNEALAEYFDTIKKYVPRKKTTKANKDLSHEQKVSTTIVCYIVRQNKDIIITEAILSSMFFFVSILSDSKIYV